MTACSTEDIQTAGSQHSKLSAVKLQLCIACFQTGVNCSLSGELVWTVHNLISDRVDVEKTKPCIYTQNSDHKPLKRCFSFTDSGSRSFKVHSQAWCEQWIISHIM